MTYNVSPLSWPGPLLTRTLQYIALVTRKVCSKHQKKWFDISLTVMAPLEVNKLGVFRPSWAWDVSDSNPFMTSWNRLLHSGIASIAESINSVRLSFGTSPSRTCLRRLGAWMRLLFQSYFSHLTTNSRICNTAVRKSWSLYQQFVKETEAYGRA